MTRYFRNLILGHTNIAFNLFVMFVAGAVFSRIADPTTLYQESQYLNKAVYVSLDRKVFIEKHLKPNKS